MKTMVLTGALALAVFVGVATNVSAQGGNGGGQGGGYQEGSSQSTTGVQTEEQNVVNNQGETTQVTTTERNTVREQGNGTGAGVGAGKGPMEDAVRTMMQIAERNQGESTQIRNRVQAQLETHRAVESDVEKLQEQNRFMRFLFGSDDKVVAEAEGLLAQNRVRIQELNSVMNKLQNEGDRTQLREQLRILEEEQTKLESRVRAEAGGFSLFGWLF